MRCPHLLRNAGIPILLVAMCSPASGEPPSLSRLFPPGAQRGQSALVESKGKYGSGEIRFWTSRPGTEWKTGSEENTFEVTVAPDAEPGVTYVRIIDDAGASELRPFVVGTLAESSETEPNNRPADANPVDALPRVLNGVLEQRGDVDGYRVAVDAGATLVASVAAERELGSGVDITLQIVTPDGHVLAQNLDYHGLDPQLVWTPEEACEIIVRVFGFPASPDSTIGFTGNENYLYRLTLTTDPFLEGTLPLAVQRDQATPVRLMGWNIPADAAEVSVTAGSGTETAAVMHPDMAGVLRLPVIPVTPLAVIPDSAPEPLAVTVPADIAGVITPENLEDTFEFEASKGTTWGIRVESRSLGYPLDAVLAVTEAATGKELAREDDAGGQRDPSLRWTAPEDGRYRVRVSDLNGYGGEHYLYRLIVEPESPHVALRVADDRYSGKVGEPLEIPIQIQRSAGFASVMELALGEVPEGVMVEAVRSEAEGDSSKEVKLKLTASAPINQAITIQGRVPDEPDSPVTATAGAYGVREIWLTIQ